VSRLPGFIVLYAAYLAAGMLPAVTSSHCRADLPLYSIGAVIATIALIASIVYEVKLALYLAKKD
jgi:hypothetical protein